MLKHCVNCWEPLRAVATLPSSNDSATRDTATDWAISSQGSNVEQGSSTIPSGSSGQGIAKCAGTSNGARDSQDSRETARG